MKGSMATGLLVLGGLGLAAASDVVRAGDEIVFLIRMIGKNLEA